MGKISLIKIYSKDENQPYSIGWKTGANLNSAISWKHEGTIFANSSEEKWGFLKREGDVILSKVVFTDLSEIKKRPVLVINSISPSDFLTLPITTSDTKAFYIPIDNDDFEEGGIPKPSKVLIPKPYILEKSLRSTKETKKL